MLMTNSKLTALCFTVLYVVLIYLVFIGQMKPAMYVMAIGMFLESLLCLINCFRK